MEMDKNNNKQPVKFNWLYLFWVLCILVLLNGLLFPVVGGAGVESTDYGTFIQRVDSGLVSKVQIKDNDIFYTILRQGKEQQCETPEVNDPQLTERLLNSPGKNAAGKISDTEFTLDFILDERAREFYLESLRRTDLIRYDRFTSDSYLWQWKGGVLDGRSVDAKYNVYPIPDTELTANSNLSNPLY